MRASVTLTLDGSSVALRYSVSGATSDADRVTFRRGLPSLMATLKREPAHACDGA